MTACVNDNQKKGGYGKAVSATLAGVLAVGMVPATALAADGDATVTSGDGIDLLSVEEATAIEQGSITGAVNAKDQSIANLTDIVFTAAKESNGDLVKYIATPTQVTSSLGTVYDLTDEDADYAGDFEVALYKADSSAANNIPGTEVKGTEIDPADPQTAVATYYSVVTYTGGDKDVYLTLEWSIENASLEGAKIFNNDSDNDGTADKNKDNTANTSFVYDAAAQVVGFQLNGKVLTETTDYTVQYQGMGMDPQNEVPEDAGNYQAVLTGAGIYAGSKATIDFTISPFDISGATITVTPAAGANTATIATLNGETGALLTALQGAAKATLTSDKTYETANLGAYTYAVALNSGVTNFTGSQSVVYDNVGTAATFSYAGAAWASAAVTTDLSAKAPQLFSTNNVKVTYQTDGSEADVPASAISYIVTDAKGNPATIADVTTPGTWKVIAKVDAKAMNYAVGGQSTAMTVTVTNGTIDCSKNLYIDYDGTLPTGDTLTAVYDGSNLLPNVNIKLVDANGKTLTQGTDYTVKITDEDGKEVSEIVNAGDYTIAVSSDSWTLNNNDSDITLTVDPVKAATVQLAGTSTINNVTPAIAYTGSDITPALEYQVTKNNDGTTPVKDAAGKEVFATLPADTYTLAIKYAGASSASATTAPGAGYDTAVKALNKPGWYQITVTAASVTPANYTVTAPAAIEVYVSDYKLFQDVPTDAWYAADVKAAYDQEYMSGYNGGQLFGPNDAIKRGDVAMVLARMGGVTLAADDDAISEIGGFVTPFSDVDPNLYYAQAIAWCANNNIITGYGDTGLFKPEAPVTREEFATMLARYAKACGTDISADADVLAGYTDASAVADWAKPFVEWTVSDKIMGVNTTVLNPISKVTRAEVAAMAVRYQPEKLS